MKTVTILPSKSYAHRAMIAAALSDDPCQIICSQRSQDMDATEGCLHALLHGDGQLLCRESGSTLRFLLPLVAALGIPATFHLAGRLPQRPLSPLYEELVAHGAVLGQQGTSPLTVDGQLTPGEYHLPGDVSSQFISGLLFALPLLPGESCLYIDGALQSAAYVEMTLEVIRRFGITVESFLDADGQRQGYRIPGNQVFRGPQQYVVEGDWSNAAFWLVAGAIGEDSIAVQGLRKDSIQGDRAVTQVLAEMGYQIAWQGDTVVAARGAGPFCGQTIDARPIPDLIPALALAAAVTPGTTQIVHAERLRIKESDRLMAIAQVLNGLGAQVTERPDGLVITGKPALAGGGADGYGDHRIVMLAAVASLVSAEPVRLSGWQAVAKSYPTFLTFGRNRAWQGI